MKSEATWVPQGSEAFDEVFETGTLRGARARIVAAEGGAVGVETFEPDERPAPLAVWMTAARAPSLTATLMPSLVTLVLVGARAPLRPLTVALAIAGAVSLQLGVNWMNDVADYRRLIDLPGTLGGAQVIQRGWLDVARVRRAARAAFALGVLLGLPALVRDPWAVASLGALGLLGAAGYSGERVGLKYVALGDLAVWLLCGPVLTAGVAVAAVGGAAALDVALPVASAGAAFGFFAVGILHTNNLQDIDEDALAGAQTVARLLGARLGRAYLVLVYALGSAFGVLTFVAFGKPWGAVPLVAAAVPAALFLRWFAFAPDLRAASRSRARLVAAQLHLALGVAFLAGALIATL